MTNKQAMRELKNAMQHIREERGTGNLQDSIARNRTLATLQSSYAGLVKAEALQLAASDWANA